MTSATNTLQHDSPNAARPALLILSLLCSLLFAAPVAAWGPEGHRVIAELAAAQLQPQVRADLDRLLSLEPGATLGSIASWADETRTDATMPWHYVNFPRGVCDYQPARDCPGGQCVVEAISRQQAVLASHADPRQRLTALKYLVHLVGDIHQPLHGSFGDDRGGNTYQLQADGSDTNLHAWWDSGMIRRHGLGSGALLAELRRAGAVTPLAQGTPQDWAQEDCRTVSSDGFYPPHRLDVADHQARWWPTVALRLRTAGQRLAAVLNETQAQ